MESLPPDSLELFGRLAAAVAIGFLVGVERGWREREEGEGARTAGIRTFALYGVLGGVTGVLALRFGALALVGFSLPFAAIVAAYYWREAVRDNSYSVTGVIAAFIVYALGVVCVAGNLEIASAAGVGTVALLALRTELHTWVRKLTWAEIRSAIFLLAMTAIALPLLPNRSMGPYGAINPFELWLMTIVLASVSFLAYVAARVLGPKRGTLTAMVLGAMVSSTAVSIDAGRQARLWPEKGTFLGGAAAFTSAVMGIRMLLIAFVLSPPLGRALAVPLGVYVVLSVLAGLWFVQRGDGGDLSKDSTVRSPLDLKETFRFAALLGALIILSTVVRAVYGEAGLLPMAALAGTTDVDAMTLSAGRLVNGGLPMIVGAHMVLIAGAVNSLFKATVAGLSGRGVFARIFGGATVVGLAGAGLALLLF